MILQIGSVIDFVAKRRAGLPVYATFSPVSNVEVVEGITHFTFPFPQFPAGAVLPTAIQVHVIKGTEPFPSSPTEVAALTNCYGRTSFPEPSPFAPGIYPNVLTVGVNTESLTANSAVDVPCKAMALAFYPDQPAT